VRAADYVITTKRRTSISDVEIWATWTNGVQNGREKGGVFVRNAMKWHFFVTIDRHLISAKTSIGVPCRTLIERFRKFSLKG